MHPCYYYKAQCQPYQRGLHVKTPPQPYSFWYSSFPSSFFDSATLRTALLKSSWLTVSR